jgi:nitroreductase
MAHPLYNVLLTIARSRKSVRAFRSERVPDDLIEKIIAVAKLSPYASARKNWGIEVVRDRSVIAEAAAVVDAASALLVERARHDYRESFRSYAENFSAFKKAPVLLIPFFRVAPTVTAMLEKNDGSLAVWERDNVVKSISCVVMLVLLAAEGLGLGACCITGALVAEDKLLRILNIKNGRHIGAIIPVGYPDKGEK